MEKHRHGFWAGGRTAPADGNIPTKEAGEMSLKKFTRHPKVGRALVISLVAAGLTFTGTPLVQTAQAADTPTWMNTSLSFEERAAALVSQMTVAEKINQLRDTAPAITRLNLPSYNYWNEALHGVMASGTTMFPSATGIASTWNRSLIGKLGTIISDEARVLNNTQNKGLTYWSPTLNIYRDPRWGRADESYSEDPYLVGEVGEQFIKGLQGNDPKYLKTISTPKHFMANNSESDRRSGNSVVSERDLREYYTPAFAHALSPEVGAYSVMTAYNRVNGVPMSASKEYLETLVKRTWGFKGFITTDCSAIKDEFLRHKWVPEGWDHNVTPQEATAWSLKAGSDIDCQGFSYRDYLQGAYNLGLVSDADLDSELTSLLTGRFKLGEFDPASKVPYKGADYSRTAKFATAENQATALQMSEEAPILLKNSYVSGSSMRGLPLGSEAKNIAVVGYLGNQFVSGGYSGYSPVDNRTFLQGVQQVAKEINPAATVTFVGNGVTPGTPSGKPGVQNVTFKSAGTVVQTIKASDTQDGYPSNTQANPAPGQFVKWEGWMGINWGYNDYMRASSVWGGYIQVRTDLPSTVDSLCITQSGNASTAAKGGVFDVFLDSMTGTKVATIPAEGAASTCGTVADSALAAAATGGVHDLYFVYNNGTLGDYGTAGTEGHPWAYDLSPDQEAQIAAADAVIVMVGTTNSEAAEEMDRVNIDFPRFQDQVVKKVSALNKRTIAWVQSVGQMNIEAFRTQANVPSIVWTNYNGQSQGVAAGEILFGKVNPSGRLPFSWYTDAKQLGTVWDYSITPGANGSTSKGRTYEYFTGDLSYNFGYGMSYSKFSYGDLKLDQSSYNGDDTISASVDVTNSSTIPGKETVQLYVTAPGADGVTRPKRQLKGFEKVALGAMETKTVTIKVPVKDLWFWDDEADKKVWDKGTWKLQVGPQANSGPTKTFSLTADPTPYLDVVAAVNDGTVLNTAAPDTVIHSNLSASRNDQTFLDLDSRNVKVEYSSSNPDVAAVDKFGVVSAKGVGVATITAKVTALGSSKTDDFAVVVNGPDTTPAPIINMADQKVELKDAASIPMNAKLALVPESAQATSITYLIAAMDENTAGATITPEGVLTATKEGKVRVTAVGDVDGVKVSGAAEVTIVKDGALAADNSALKAAIAAAEALVKSATPASAAASGLPEAIATAKAALEATDQKVLDNALGDLGDAVAAAQDKLVLIDTPSARAAAVAGLKGVISKAEAIDPSSFNAESYKALKAAVDEAKALVADPNATVEQIQAATAKVLDAIFSAPSTGGRTALDAAGAVFTVVDKVYTGSQIKSGFTVTIDGKRLYEGVDFATSVLGANTAIGKGSVTIVGKGDYTGTKVLSFNIDPTKTSVSKAKAGKKSVAVSYKKVSSSQKVSKYQVRYRVKGTSSWKTTTISASKSSVTLKKLKKGKVYQVEVRSYKTVAGINYYSAWSASKYSAKVK
jgi:beta-glucosidase